MAWLLVDTESDLVVDIPASGIAPEAVRVQWNRLGDEQAKDAFAQKLAASFESSLLNCLDSDLKPPTAAQVAFAIAISRRLGVSASTEVFKYRGAMTDFLSEHAPEFKARVAIASSEKAKKSRKG